MKSTIKSCVLSLKNHRRILNEDTVTSYTMSFYPEDHQLIY